MSKHAAKNEIESTAEAVPEIRIAKIASCETFSGLSTLEYHLGYEANTPDALYFRIWKNSGGGKFNTDWVALAHIETVLAQLTDNFTSAALTQFLPGRSVNTPAFLGAALKAEGLITHSLTVARNYARTDTALWKKEISTLIESGIDLTATVIDTPERNRASGGNAGCGAGTAGGSKKKSAAKDTVKPIQETPHGHA